MAVFHFPLRSDNSTQASDPLLQNSTANPNASTSLEALLAGNGVSIVFNGHAHTYQRIIPRQAGQITNYVTGGGGGVLEPVTQGRTCTALLATEDIYALGWSPSGAGPTAGSGSSCGPGTSTPQSAADVYNFLEGEGLGHHRDGRRRSTPPASPSTSTPTRRPATRPIPRPRPMSRPPPPPRRRSRSTGTPPTRPVEPSRATPSTGTSAAGATACCAKVPSPATDLHGQHRPARVPVRLPGHRHRQRPPPQTSAAGTSNKVATPSVAGGGHGHGHLGGVGRPRLDSLVGGRQRNHRLVPDRPGRDPAGLGDRGTSYTDDPSSPTPPTPTRSPPSTGPALLPPRPAPIR